MVDFSTIFKRGAGVGVGGGASYVTPWLHYCTQKPSRKGRLP